VLVGGTSRVPYLRTLLQAATKGEVVLFDPDEAAATGLALIGNLRVGVSYQCKEIDSSWFTGCPVGTTDTRNQQVQSYGTYSENYLCYFRASMFILKKKIL